MTNRERYNIDHCCMKIKARTNLPELCKSCVYLEIGNLSWKCTLRYNIFKQGICTNNCIDYIKSNNSPCFKCRNRLKCITEGV